MVISSIFDRSSTRILCRPIWVGFHRLIFYSCRPRICRAIIALIDDAIDDFYRDKCCSSLLFNKKEENKSKNGPLPKVESWADVVEKIAPILWYLGPRIGYNATTTTKFIRLLAVFFEERKNSPSTSDDKSIPLFFSHVICFQLLM